MGASSMPSQPAEDAKFSLNKAYIAHWTEIWSLGMTIVIGGQYFGWNPGLTAGFGSFLLATLLIGTGYVALIFSACEIASALPFAGAFGICRCSLGFFPGFLVGCGEVVEYIVYVSTSCLSLCTMICSFSGLDPKWNPLMWLVFYGSALSIHIYGGALFWRSSFIMGVLSFLIIVIYSLGGIRYGDFNTNAPSADPNNPNDVIYFVGGFESFMFVLPLAAWFYVGVESLGFAYNAVEDVGRDITWGSVTCIVTLFVTSLFVLFVSSSISTVSDVATALSPLDTGNAAIYNVPLEWAGVFAIPATYATAFGFIFSYGRLLESMSQSGLMPAVLSLTTTNSGQPYVAMLAGSLIGYFICLVAFYYPFVSLQLFNVCCLLAFVCYCCQCFSYWMVVTRFQNIPRSFRSPLGLAGAVWAASVFLLGAIAVIFFQKDGGFAVITVLCLTSLFSLYYYTTVVNTQCFSHDEGTVMFKAYVINANYIKNRSRKQSRGRAKGGSEVTSFSDHLASLTLRAASWLSGGISPVSATNSAKVYAFSDSAAESESQATLTQTQTQSQTHATASKIGGGESSVADALVLEEAQTEESF